MNMQLQTVVKTGTDGRTLSVERCYIRGSQIRFVIVPDMLKNAPMFKRLEKGGRGALGLGRAVGLRGRGRGGAPRGGAGAPPGGRGGPPGRGRGF